MTSENFNYLSADKPITNPKDDRLGYAPFAKTLADSICKMIPPEGVVIAIHATWGSGKTTLLNFVAHYLQQIPESEQLVIVQFNPWWFSGHEDLTRQFFDQLQGVLKHELRSEDFRKLASNITMFVSKTVPHAGGGEVVAKWLERDVPELKKRIADALKMQQKRILVIIDDVDRLTAEEIRQLFRVIKAVADFPNVVYLLAFDKEVVIKALNEAQGVPGEDYLEKIVQVPFELPLPGKLSLRQLLFEKLDAILADTPDDLLDQTYWGNVYLQGIDHFISTPRDVVRLTNTLSVTYPAVKGEVNPVDFVAIEALRIFRPPIYDMIRGNPSKFAGTVSSAPSVLRRRNVEDLKNFHNSWMEELGQKVEDVLPIKRILVRVFPMLQSVWSNTFYNAESESKWRSQRRISSPDIFPVYFRLAIPEGDISNAEMKAILAAAKDVNAFGEKLVELADQKRPDGRTRVSVFLERLGDYTEKDISLESIPSVVQALFDIGDQLLRPEDEPRGVLEFTSDFKIGHIIWQLLWRLDEPERFKMLEMAISKGHAVATIVQSMTTLGQQHGKYGADQPSLEDERLIGEQHVVALEALALQKVRNAAQQGTLLQTPRLPDVLRRWRDWADQEEVRQWVQNTISDDMGLVAVLEKFLYESFSHQVSDAVARREYRLNPRWLEPLIDASQIIDRVRSLAEDRELTENQRTAVGQFIREYEMIQQGKNPDSPFAWRTE